VADTVNARTTFFFEDGKYGWSESYFSQPASVQAARAAALLIAPKRIALLGTGPVFAAIRVSDADIERDSLITLAADIPTGKDRREEASDVPYSSWLCQLSNGTRYKRPLYLRGCPDIDITDPEDAAAHGVFKKAWAAYVAALIAGGYMLRVLLRGTDNPSKKITDVFGDAAGFKVTTAAHGLVNNDVVRISGVKGSTVPKGKYTVRKVDDDNFVALHLPAPGAVGYTGGGEWTKQIIGFKPVTEGIIVRQTRRATGRPFDSPHGRRKARTA